MGWSLAGLVALGVFAASCAGQVPAATAAELQQMAGDAGVIFAGQVMAVSREDAAGYVDVRFQIESGIRGCPNTGVYVLREWAGLWTGQPERYRVGQRRLMLLTARGPSGMSSPVGGMDGAIPLVHTGVAPVADVAGNAPADTAGVEAEFAVDLRWIQARTLLGAAASSRVVAVGNPAKQWAGVGAVGLASVLTLLRGNSARVSGGVGDARY